jgi:pimeloyl-ACP methyl ester carboxylesterase
VGSPGRPPGVPRSSGRTCAPGRSDASTRGWHAALQRLWFTPWVHPSALAPVDDLPSGTTAWYLRAGGHVLHGYAVGSGPTVVLVHGWSGRAADWRHLAAALVADGWRVVVPDLPAHGRTAGDTVDLFELGHAVAAVLRHERPSAVVAHSMGFPATMVALEVGAPAPAQLVALAPGRRLRDAFDAFGRRTRLRPALVRELRHAVEGRYGDDIWDVLDVDRVLPDLRIAGLVVHGVDDDEVPVRDGQHIADTWPEARFVATEGLGHRRILRDDTVHDLVLRELTPTGAELVPDRAGRPSGPATRRRGHLGPRPR